MRTRPDSEFTTAGFLSILFALLLSCSWLRVSEAATTIRGQVTDTDGKPVSMARITVSPFVRHAGAVFTTVFTDPAGKFTFPETTTADLDGGFTVVARALNYEQISPAKERLSTTESAGEPENGVHQLTIVMRNRSDQAPTAPASAWLKDVKDDQSRAKLLVECVNCHQFPTPEVHDFMATLSSVDEEESETANKRAWHAKIDSMSAIFAAALARGRVGSDPGATEDSPGGMEFFNPEDVAAIIGLLTRELPAGNQTLEGYDYGAPPAVNEKTVIREYEVPGLNAIREAISLGSPAQLWVADFYGDKLTRIDAATGAQKDFVVPYDQPSGPHTLVRGKDGSLWLSGVFNGFVGQLEPRSLQWRTWHLESQPSVSVHDLTYNFRNELVEDTQGRIWYSDINNNALGSFNPTTGAESSFPAPVKSGRKPGEMSLYGIVMTSDREHVCYTQLGGDFGCFNTGTLEFESRVPFPVGAGPRRMAITQDDIIYIPLFGAGQLIEYDARADKKVASYDLPDRASGPYAATWDAKRAVVWIATSNADVIYRFDTDGKTFGVIPLPRQKAYLRMLAVDPFTGHLVTSYGNLPETVTGPRMAVVLDPGD